MRPTPDTGRRRVAGDRGAVSVWWALCLAALSTVSLAVLALGAAAAARHRAGAAADLAALAAADRVAAGGGGACAVARRVAADNGARVVRCHLDGPVVDLTTQLDVGPFTPRARARAGPPAAAP